MENLRRALGFGGVLSPAAIEHIINQFEERQLRPAEDFIAIGSVADHIGFLAAGFCRAYLRGQDSATEVTRFFMRPQQFIMDSESFYSHRPTDTGVQALTPCQLLCIDRPRWQRLNEEVPQLFMLSKMLTEATLLNKLKDNDFLLFGTATQKYLEFCRRYPELVLSIPQHYIASYLQITPQSLSRIRKSGLSGRISFS